MARLPWEHEAVRELFRVPFFVRPLVRRKVEERVTRRGGKAVTLEDFREAEARYRAVAGDRSEQELERMMPRKNQAGVEMAVVETCHHELSQCPNLLLPTTEWKAAIENRLRKDGISERLRKRVAGDQILYHHKLRISISGCPNGCSRPQIADFGLIGRVRPEVDPAACRSCGACAEVCPDRAVTVEESPPVFDRLSCQGCKKCREICPAGSIYLSPPTAWILAGGKLGRHPCLAEVIGEAQTPEQAAAVLSRLVEDFLAHAAAEERFADYYGKTKNPGAPAPDQAGRHRR